MIRSALPVLLATALAAADVPAPAATAPPAAFAEKAAALAPAGTARPALIAALHRYVRDEIQQVATKYG